MLNLSKLVWAGETRLKLQWVYGILAEFEPLKRCYNGTFAADFNEEFIAVIRPTKLGQQRRYDVCKVEL